MAGEHQITLREESSEGGGLTENRKWLQQLTKLQRDKEAMQEILQANHLKGHQWMSEVAGLQREKAGLQQRVHQEQQERANHIPELQIAVSTRDQRITEVLLGPRSWIYGQSGWIYGQSGWIHGQQG
jgi:hypothetical protein